MVDLRVISVFLLVTLGVTSSYGSYPPPQCYQYQDHAAKYKLRHDKDYYPSDEINLVLTQYPYMQEMFYEDEHAHITAQTNPLLQPLASVCPYNKYTLYSFYYANKDCYVIYPDVQKVSYVQCSADYNRDCQQCTYHGGVSKCDEDYEYRYVWAYCTYQVTPKTKPDIRPVYPQPDPVPVLPDIRPIYPQPDPHPVQPDIRPIYPKPDPVPVQPKHDPHPHPDPKPYPNPNLYPEYPDSKQKKTTYPKSKSHYPYPSYYNDPWNRYYKPHVVSRRWKRSYHEPQPNYGTIERMALYLPQHCGCKTYRC